MEEPCLVQFSSRRCLRDQNERAVFSSVQFSSVQDGVFALGISSVSLFLFWLFFGRMGAPLSGRLKAQSFGDGNGGISFRSVGWPNCLPTPPRDDVYESQTGTAGYS